MTAAPRGLPVWIVSGVTAPLPPPPALVFAVTALLGADWFPARSRARTGNVKVGFAGRLPTVAPGVSVDATGVLPPSWYTSYPARPMPPVLSVEAFQAGVTVEAVCAVECRLPGTLGGVLSFDGLVVATASLLSCEELPAPSRATIVNTYWVPGVSLATVAASVPPFTFMTCWPCLNTSYSVTPTLSVDLVQASEIVVSVTPVPWLFVGEVGGLVSAASAGVAANATRARPPTALAATSVLVFTEDSLEGCSRRRAHRPDSGVQLLQTFVIDPPFGLPQARVAIKYLSRWMEPGSAAPRGGRPPAGNVPSVRVIVCETSRCSAVAPIRNWPTRSAHTWRRRCSRCGYSGSRTTASRFSSRPTAGSATSTSSSRSCRRSRSTSSSCC